MREHEGLGFGGDACYLWTLRRLTESKTALGLALKLEILATRSAKFAT